LIAALHSARSLILHPSRVLWQLDPIVMRRRWRFVLDLRAKECLLFVTVARRLHV